MPTFQAARGAMPPGSPLERHSLYACLLFQRYLPRVGDNVNSATSLRSCVAGPLIHLENMVAMSSDSYLLKTPQPPCQGCQKKRVRWVRHTPRPLPTLQGRVMTPSPVQVHLVRRAAHAGAAGDRGAVARRPGLLPSSGAAQRTRGPRHPGPQAQGRGRKIHQAQHGRSVQDLREPGELLSHSQQLFVVPPAGGLTGGRETGR